MKSSRNTLLLSLTLTTLLPGYAQKASYTLQDLQTLAGQAAWSELAIHLDDIAPSNRNTTWQKLAEQTALGLLEEARRTENPIQSLGATETLIDQYPTLKKSSAVMSARAKVGLQVFSTCFELSYYSVQLILIVW